MQLQDVGSMVFFPLVMAVLVVMVYRTVTFTQTIATGTEDWRRLNSNTCIATYYKNKYREQAAVSGHYQAAKNLRKQGVPIDIARQILFAG